MKKALVNITKKIEVVFDYDTLSELRTHLSKMELKGWICKQYKDDIGWHVNYSKVEMVESYDLPL